MRQLNAQVESKQVGYQAFFAFQVEKRTGIGQSVYQAKKQGKEINNRQPCRLLLLLLADIVHGGSGNRKGYQEFDPGSRKMYIVQRAQRQGHRMTDGKSGHKNGYFFPVLPQVAQAEGGYKEDMIHSLPCKDMPGA